MARVRPLSPGVVVADLGGKGLPSFYMPMTACMVSGTDSNAGDRTNIFFYFYSLITVFLKSDGDELGFHLSRSLPVSEPSDD